MIYRFGVFELDTAKAELRASGVVIPVEPQVFALLALLVENRERLVSKDEVIEKVWDGRIVSESAVASRIKSARKALGDDGARQRFIKTLHGKGFRFVEEVKAVRAAGMEPGTAQSTAVSLPASTKPSIAVLPFRLLGTAGAYSAIADALPHELITSLARLRWLFVTARGSSFRMRGLETEASEVGRSLGVRYYLAGTVEDTRDGGIIWAERFAGALDDVHQIREQICAKILAALEVQIPLHEAMQARLAITGNLNAWEAYHLGLQHMYRFNNKDGEAAAALFRRSITQDPAFARAHAGLSFIHFQSVFMRYAADIPGEIACARRFAERGLELDPLDPFVNFAMGRTFWLQSDLQTSLGWLERATALSPNYAQGLYARAWTESLAGRSGEARQHVDLAMRLSPLDPLHYAMQGTRAFTHVIAGEDSEAADWAERAACSPGAHVLIALIATACHALAGHEARAAVWAANVRARNPALTVNAFFGAFPMQSASTRARIATALARHGF
jgi:DNA-binding winged helix-turn-helix (wHTH) protein/tetratricopeptide (TPR) repeat protein